MTLHSQMGVRKLSMKAELSHQNNSTVISCTKTEWYGETVRPGFNNRTHIWDFIGLSECLEGMVLN